MKSADIIFMGIDPASGTKELTYAAIDEGLNLVELADADMDELLSTLDKFQSATVAVNAPLRVSQGLVKKKLASESHQPGRIFRGVDIRLVEYDLRQRGISVSGTPSNETYCPAWMRVGFALYQNLSEIGFKSHGTDANRQFLETQPHACFCVLAEGIPFPKPTLEGRLQRQLLLNDKGLRITDGMDFFEEITRFKLMRGILSMDALYAPEQLDVLVSAYTAWLAASRPAEVVKVGDEGEGQMILPARELLEKY